MAYKLIISAPFEFKIAKPRRHCRAFIIEMETVARDDWGFEVSIEDIISL